MGLASQAVGVGVRGVGVMCDIGVWVREVRLVTSGGMRGYVGEGLVMWGYEGM